MPFESGKLGGNTAKFPYLVGVTTAAGCLGTGILIGTRFVLTCSHVLDEDTSAEIITSQGRTSACTKKVDNSLDLALLELAEPVSANSATFADLDSHPGAVLRAVGVQAMPGEPDHLVVAEVELKYRNKNDADGKILDIQFDGGARPGYSGGPVVAQQDGSLVCVGIIRCGGNWAASSNAIGLGSIRAFVADYLPAAGLHQLGPAKQAARRGIVVRRAFVAAVILLGVAIGANAGWKYLARGSPASTGAPATSSSSSATTQQTSAIKEHPLSPPEPSADRSRPDTKTTSPPTDATSAKPGETSSAQTPEETFVSKYVDPEATNGVQGQQRWSIVIAADGNGFPNLVSAISAQVSSIGGTPIAIFRPSITGTDGFHQLFAGDPALNRRLGKYCDRILVGKVTSSLTKNTEYGIFTLGLSLQAKLISTRLGAVETQFMISENGAGMTREEATLNAEERLTRKLKERLATGIER